MTAPGKCASNRLRALQRGGVDSEGRDADGGIESAAATRRTPGRKRLLRLGRLHPIENQGAALNDRDELLFSDFRVQNKTTPVDGERDLVVVA